MRAFAVALMAALLIFTGAAFLQAFWPGSISEAPATSVTTPRPTSTVGWPMMVTSSGTYIGPIDSVGVSLTVGLIDIRDSAGYARPQAGKEYVVLFIDLVNNGSRRAAYSANDFKMQDGQGNITRRALFPDMRTELGSGELASGGRVSGTLAFEVLKDDRSLMLLWEPRGTDEKQIDIKAVFE